MVWKRRLCGERLYHHIYAWGNDRHPVFKARGHYLEYIKLLKKNSDDYRMNIVAYALMEWHVHLFVYDKKNNISNFMYKLHGDYAKYYNRSTDRVGHVFGERFNNKIVQPNQYGLWLSRYIHLQPVEAGIVQAPEDYPWTSYKVYIGLAKGGFVKPDVILNQFGDGEERYVHYKEFIFNVSTDSPPDQTAGILRNTNVKNIIAIASQALNVNQAILLHPVGKGERKKRQDAIRFLIIECGYKKSEVAACLGLSRAAITQSIKGDKK